MVLLEIRGNWSREVIVASLSTRVGYGRSGRRDKGGKGDRRGLESSMKCNRSFWLI